MLSGQAGSIALPLPRLLLAFSSGHRSKQREPVLSSGLAAATSPVGLAGETPKCSIANCSKLSCVALWTWLFAFGGWSGRVSSTLKHVCTSAIYCLLPQPSHTQARHMHSECSRVSRHLCTQSAGWRALGCQCQQKEGQNVCSSSPGGTSPKKNHQLVTVVLIMNLAQSSRWRDQAGSYCRD